LTFPPQLISMLIMAAGVVRPLLNAAAAAALAPGAAIDFDAADVALC